MIFGRRMKIPLPGKSVAQPGREAAMPVPERHFVNGNALQGPYPSHLRTAVFGLGCFWGAERRFWETRGVWSTAVGYAGGETPNPTYQEVCSGATGHAEVVLVVYDPARISFEGLLTVFWEAHDPTQGMRQGYDIGTQYRSGIYTNDAQEQAVAKASRSRYQAALDDAGYGSITTEVATLGEFYFTEDYHQQYLAKNPGGYCGIGGTGVGCPAGSGSPVTG
jgi:peptide-methionine (S)-S-oxide reductase